MKRLSLEELKAQKGETLSLKSIEELESIKGGDFDWCHFWHKVHSAFVDTYESGAQFGIPR
jgi:hypothetical protein